MTKSLCFRQIGILCSFIVFVSFVLANDTAYALDFSEAPELAAKVSAGTLPSVAKRLPQNPVLVQPEEEIGTYGGTWHMAMRRDRDHALMIRTIGYENLVRWTPDWNGIITNIAESYTVNDNATQFTFRLRKGMRWSNGQPFGVEDILFWYEDVVLNEELAEGLDIWRVSGGENFTVKKLDEDTIQFEFKYPHGLFLQNLAAPEGAEPTSYPSEFLKPFHIKYNPDANELAKEQGFANWVELFKSKFGNPGTIDDKSRWTQQNVPTLNAWVLDGTYTIDEPLTASRNPYYWKIDPAGKQLPYINAIYFEVVDGKSDAREVARNGKVDMQFRHMGDFAEEVHAYPEKFDDIASINSYDTDMNIAVISLNLNHKDPNTRKLFQNKAFRVALSHGFNRTAIINDLLDGVGSPYQAAPRPESIFYHEKLAQQYLEYDIEKSNRLLDTIGLENRDSEGFRLDQTGKRISFTMDTVGEDRFSIISLIAIDWKKIGIDITPRNMDRDVYYEDRAANLHDISVWGGEGGLDPLLSPIYYFPFTYESFHAIKWAMWFQDPNSPQAEEPPASVKKQMALYRELTAQGNNERHRHYMKEILDIAADDFLVIGSVLPSMRYGIKKKNFKNVPILMPSGWSYPHPAPSNPSQYFIDQ